MYSNQFSMCREGSFLHEKKGFHNYFVVMYFKPAYKPVQCMFAQQSFELENFKSLMDLKKFKVYKFQNIADYINM